MISSVTVTGAELFYTTRGGEGTGPVCLIPSAIGTRPYEAQMVSPLGDRLRLVFVDLRGAGRSTGDPADLTFDVLAEDLEAIRRAVGAPRVVVLGHSILGMLAVEYARRCPDTVSHAVVVGTPPNGDMRALLSQSAAFFEADASDQRKQLLKQSMAALPPAAGMDRTVLAQTPMRFFDPRADATATVAEAVARPQFLAHVMGRLARGWDVTAGAPALRVPLLVAHGRWDYTVPHTMWDGALGRLREAGADATFRLFEKSGHQPFFEEPERFTAVLTDWMAGAR